LHKGVDTGADHAQGQIGHGFQVDGQVQGGAAIQLQRPLGDVHSLVADTFEGGGDAHGCRDQTQIGSYRLPQGQEPVGPLLNFQFHVVYLNVIGNDIPGQVRVAGGDGRQAFPHGLCRHGGHP